jgi:hypothetical protein
MAAGPAESLIIAGRRFVCNADDDVNIRLPGFTNEVKMHGDGSAHSSKSRKAGRISSLNLYVNNEENDLEYLQEQMDKHEFLDISLTMCDGTVYAGSMVIVGESTEEAIKEGWAPIEFEGPTLEKQG